MESKALAVSRFLVAGTVILTGAALRPAFAVSNVCPSGTCVIENPIYVNVYWDESVDRWNADIAATDAKATVGAIDALTEAICNSAYFSGLDQYNIKSCRTRPSIVENACGKPPANLDQAHDALGTFASCVLQHNPGFDLDRTVLNVFLPPQTRTVPNSDFCSKMDGQHTKYGSPVAVTFNMTNSACHGGLGGIVSTLTHEMVEAATDPIPDSPTGWKTITGQEVADQCEHRKPASSPFLFGEVALYFSDQLGVCVDGMETQERVKISSVKACGAGAKMKITVKGTIGPAPWDLDDSDGRSLFLSAAVSGKNHWGAGKPEPPPTDEAGLGPVTWTHIPAPPSCSSRCETQEGTCMGTAHDSGERQACVAAKGVCLAACKTEPAPVSGDTIVIHGFNGRYGAAVNGGAIAQVAPGDTITVTASSFLSGGSASATVAVPAANRVRDLAWHPNPHHGLTVSAGDSVDVSGRLEDAEEDESCGEQGIEVAPTSDRQADSFYPIKMATDADGAFDFQFTAGGTAGTHHVKIKSPVAADLPVDVHPLADELSASTGGVAGGQVIRLTGRGFDTQGTSVFFRSAGHSAKAASLQVISGTTVQFATPPTPQDGAAPGTVDVVATVNGQDSAPLSYLYIVPNRPVFKFTAACRIGNAEAMNSLLIEAFNADGSSAQETIALSAGAPVLLDSSAHLVSSITVQPGTTVQVKGVDSPPFVNSF